MIKKYISPDVETTLSQNMKYDEAHFPLLCKIAERKTEDQIINLFINLEDFFQQDIIAFKNKNNLKFCVITLCALLNNNFKEKMLNEVFESDFEMQAFENICSEFNLGPNKDTVKSKIKEQLENLQDTYVAKTENGYHFIHTKEYQIAVSVCGNILLHNFIKFVRSSFIAECFCFQSSMEDSKKHLIIIDDENVVKRYFDQLLFDLKKGDTYSTFHNFVVNHIRKKSYFTVKSGNKK
ncbi:unnamed protein product [Mytilus coruscus]|uniref:Uncharacterized protein n=1 Tax=Mytilus coruscus TaxID=42192 RepID=A0A6J8ET82_MYTCO|nr:unnamed protein product [Mytilus coruscus]